jgi:hypothetical protein
LSLSALICAYHDAPDGPGGLRATLPLAGRTLVERQARLAAEAGANPVVILVERVPAELAAVIDRLRSEGVAAVVARSVGDAAEAIRPDDRLLVVADGLVVDRAHLSRLLTISGPALLTLPDSGGDRFERIDADARWAGLALLSGTILKDTGGHAAGLGSAIHLAAAGGAGGAPPTRPAQRCGRTAGRDRGVRG